VINIKNDIKQEFWQDCRTSSIVFQMIKVRECTSNVVETVSSETRPRPRPVSNIETETETFP